MKEERSLCMVKSSSTLEMCLCVGVQFLIRTQWLISSWDTAPVVSY